MSSVEARIKACIEQLIKELDLLFQQRTLESLRTLLAGAVAPAPRARPLARAARGDSAPREGVGDVVRAHIRSSPGESKPRSAKSGSAKPGHKPKAKRRGRKLRRSKEGTGKTRIATELEKQRRAKRPKKRTPTRSPRRVVVPARRRQSPAVRPAELQPAAGPVEAAQPELEFVE